MLRGPVAPDGSPTWSVYDPTRAAYFRIGWRAMEILTRWGVGRAGAVAKAVRDETTVDADAREVLALAEFLRRNDLLISADRESVAHLIKRDEAGRRSWLHQAIHGYLFFRIPLLRPDRFLDATLPLMSPFFSVAWRWTVICLGLLGLALAARQWAVFQAGFVEMASWEGAIGLFGTLAVIKVAHEFGHAYTAKRHGCPVNSMGVAFMVMWPVLYTDTTHAYRLTSRRKRLEVAGGGIMVEMAIAAIATLVWALSPDGVVRQAAHTAATVSWIGTVAINLNPLMRFDGYYLLADAVNMPNLQDRAFAMAKWWLRRLLFGLDDPMPERMAPTRRHLVIAYAFATWIYRLILFLGIAILVYHLAFKALGVILMAIEVIFFIALPIFRELRVWWKRRDDVGVNRHVVATGLGLLVIMGFLATPLPWPVKAPAIIQPEKSAALRSPSPARVTAVHVRPGDTVIAGAPLMTLESPELAFEGQRVTNRIKSLEALIERESAVAEAAEKVAVLRQELRTSRALADGLAEMAERLIIRAPFDGRVVDLLDPMAPGQWVNVSAVLARVVSTTGVSVTALVAADDLSRVSVGAGAHFIPNDAAAKDVPLTVASVALSNLDTLDIPHLSQTHGGPIPVEMMPGPQRRERPLIPVYRVTLDGPAISGPGAERAAVGLVAIDSPPMSLLRRAWRAAAAVLIRESGF